MTDRPARRRSVAAVVWLAASIAAVAAGGGAPARQMGAATLGPDAVPALLDRYLAGEFDAVMAIVGSLDSLEPILLGLTKHGDAWIDRAGAGERLRRRLAAATLALEAARLGVWKSWKVRLRQPPMSTPDGGLYQPRDLLFWAPSARLVEWGCARFRRDPEPGAGERWWQLGAMAVAEKAQDAEFLVGESEHPPSNEDNVVTHLEHALERFPDEPRFLLVHALTLEWRTWPEVPRGRRMPAERLAAALEAYLPLEWHESIGPEATIRRAALFLRGGEPLWALERLTAVEFRTRDRYLVYLARYFRGKALEALRRPAEAIEAYRGAVATLPGAQAASLALAALLVNAGGTAEAQALAGATLALAPFDPWRGWADADDRFWPEILARLRREIAP